VKRVADGSTWRCPHCRTLQPESTTCRACGRSAVSCRTCHLFSISVVGGLGFCASDAARAPLTGDEVRPCWVGHAQVRSPAGGLFAEQLLPPAPPAPGTLPTTESGQASPFVDDAFAPAGGRLVEAPSVPPSRTIVSELRRRSDAGRD
jgi:hypothetical protein